MSECCGKPCAGRFCPNCGKAQEQTPLNQLLAHVRKTEAAHHRRVKRNFEPGKLRTWDRAALKWKTWGDALAELLIRAEPKEEPS
jgi:hypothetical protein